MGADIQTELRIPDLWYDFYARLLPGCAFMAAARTLIYGNSLPPTPTELLLLTGGGYFLGLLLHPISSLVTGWIHRCAEIRHKKPEGYVRKLGQCLGPDSRWTIILSKMHAETTFFVQLGILSVGLALLQLPDFPLERAGFGFFLIILPVLLLAGAYRVASARVLHAADYEPTEQKAFLDSLASLSSTLVSECQVIAARADVPPEARSKLTQLGKSIHNRLDQIQDAVPRLRPQRKAQRPPDDAS